MKDAKDSRCLEDGRKEPQAKECKCPLGGRKGKKIDSSLELPEEQGLTDTLVLVCLMSRTIR